MKKFIEKLTANKQDVDMWLFSGQIPYGYAKKWAGISQPMFYVPSSGSSLYKTLLHITYQQKMAFDRLSFDTFHPAELERVFKESEIDFQPKYLMHYEEEISTDEVVGYHYELWKKRRDNGRCHMSQKCAA